jgi:hypothetical protein
MKSRAQPIELVELITAGQSHRLTSGGKAVMKGPYFYGKAALQFNTASSLVRMKDAERICPRVS